MADRMKSEKIKSAITSIKTTLEKRRQNESDDAPWIKQVAVLSGTLAALTGFLTVRVTTLTNDAIYESNQAILAQTQSSDHWAEYQAASIKSRIVETALISSSNLSRAKREELTATAQDFRDRQPELKKAAIEKKSGTRRSFTQRISATCAKKYDELCQRCCADRHCAGFGGGTGALAQSLLS